MASAKDSNSSKTEHVMNLISRNRAKAPAADQSSGAPAASDVPAASNAPAASEAPRKTVPSPPIITSLQNDMAVSSKIKDALEATLESKLSEEVSPAAAPEPEPGPEPEPKAEAPVSSESVSPAEAPSAAGEAAGSAGPEASAPEPPKETPQPAVSIPEAPGETPRPEASAPPPHEVAREAPPPTPSSPETGSGDAQDEILCENIMYQLVEEKTDKYIELFGLCRCARCKKDVMAMALNELPPKYVVMPKRELSPRLSVYDGRFSSAVIAQILRACAAVLENPRHDLSGG